MRVQSGETHLRPSRGGKRTATAGVHQELQRILLSPDFDATRRSRDFLCFVVQEALAGRGGGLSQAAIATSVFGRKDDFDPLLDPIVRIQAGRLRRSLERYYLLGGRADPVRIELPKGSYVPAFAKASPAGGAAEEASHPGPARPAHLEWPSICVGSFESSAGGEADGLAARLDENVALELGRYGDAGVVLGRDEQGRDPGRGRARFKLRGTVRPAADGAMLVTTRLVDRSSGRQIWAEEFETGPGMDRPTVHPQDVARIIAARVGAEQGVVAQTLLGERGHLSYDGLYGAILRSYNFFFAREVRELAPTLGALRRGVADEPENALAWTQLGRLIQVNHVFELTEQRTPLDEAIACGYQAVRLDPSLTRARCVLAASLLAQGELEAGRNELEQALRLNPRSLVYLEIVGWLLALLGDWERGIALGREAMARNPHHLPHVYMGLWADHLRRGELEEAHKAALEYRDSAFFWRSLMRTSSLGLLGRREEARASAAVLMREKPTFKERGRVLIGHYLKAASLQERVIEGLRHAGLALR